MTIKKKKKLEEPEKRRISHNNIRYRSLPLSKKVPTVIDSQNIIDLTKLTHLSDPIPPSQCEMLGIEIPKSAREEMGIPRSLKKKRFSSN